MRTRLLVGLRRLLPWKWTVAFVAPWPGRRWLLTVREELEEQLLRS